MALTASEIPGRAVVDVTGVVIGRVSRLNVDADSWAISSLAVTLSRPVAHALGVHGSWLRPPTLDIPTGVVMGAADVIVLRVQVDELHGLVPETRRGYLPDADVDADQASPVH